jgi:energy-coupling factor transporter ATP-binding protein EcfA2
MSEVTSVVEQILEWSGTRPLWQQDALRRLVTGAPIDDKVVQAYTSACLGQDAGALEPLDDQHLRSNGTEMEAVVVLGIHGAVNVNSLSAGEHLTFAPVGLTIVYGDNASGKSGYARILKSVTRTRASERVRNDVFQAANLVPQATIDYQVGNTKASLEWRPQVRGSDDLARLSFFDRACSAIYLSRETDVAFRPFGLGLFDELVGICERVRDELDRRGNEAGSRTPGLPVLDDSSEAGRFLQGLRASTPDEDFSAATAFSEGHQQRLKVLLETAELHQQGAAPAEAQRLLRLAQRGDRVKQVVERLASDLSARARNALIVLRDDARSKREVARLAQAQSLSGTRLGGVGEAAWRELWEAARLFSQTAYPGRGFPVVDEAACVLCQQPLDTSASERLRGFEAFVRDTTQESARNAERDYRVAVERVNRIQIQDQATTDAVHDLRPEDVDVANAIDEYLVQAGQSLAALKGALLDDAPERVEVFPSPPLERIDRLLLALKDRVAQLQTGQPAGGAEIAVELSELKARKALADARASVTSERRRLQLLSAVSAARTSASTNAVTQKGVDLTNQALTEVLIDRFSRETDRLGLEKVVLRTVGGRRGVLMYRTGFVGAVQEAPLPEVLSEGEQTALGMAGFLAEVWTDGSKSGSVFDDPVNSLDHGRRDKVAERLVTLAQERQTIVFTHDIAFVLALKKHAVARSVSVTERSVEKLNAKPGHCEDHHKFSAKLVKERLTELDNELTSIRTGSSSMTADQYRDATARWYRLLRQTWERAIEESLVGDILTRDDLQVHPMMVRSLVLFTADDNRELQRGYSRATELSEVHDESALINAPAASIEDVATDLRNLREWHGRVGARRNLSEQKVYELAERHTG